MRCGPAARPPHRPDLLADLAVAAGQEAPRSITMSTSVPAGRHRVRATSADDRQGGPPEGNVVATEATAPRRCRRASRRASATRSGYTQTAATGGTAASAGPGAGPWQQAADLAGRVRALQRGQVDRSGSPRPARRHLGVPLDGTGGEGGRPRRGSRPGPRRVGADSAGGASRIRGARPAGRTPAGVGWPGRRRRAGHDRVPLAVHALAASVPARLRPGTRTTASLAARAVANPGLITVSMIRSRSSKWANALFTASMVSDSKSRQP